MQIDRTITDRASPGDRDDRLTAFGQQRPQHADAGPHRLDDVVAGFALGFVPNLDIERAVQGGPAPVAGVGFGLMTVNMASQFTDELGHRIDVAEPRNAMQSGLSVGKQACRDDRQRAVLAAADFDFAFESSSATNEK